MDQTPPPPPPSGDDYASRFRKPGEGPEPGAKPAGEPPPPRPQGLGQMLEDTLVAPFQLGALFSSIAQQPPPGYGVMTANLAAYWAAFFGVNLLHVAITNPKALEAVATRSQAAMALAGVGALIFVTLASFAAAGALHLAATLAGGQGDYRRSYQVLSLVSLTAPLQALMNWAPFLWPLPVLAGTYMTVVACEHLHKAPPLRARAVFGALMIGALGLQWFARVQVDRVAQRYRAIRDSAEILEQVNRQLQAQGQPGLPGAQSLGLVAPPGAGASGLGASPTQGSGASGLSLLSAPTLQGGGKLTPAQTKQLAQASEGILKSVTPLLDDPNMTKGMSPEQQRQLREAFQMIGAMQSKLQAGKEPTPEERQKMMQKVLELQQSAMQKSVGQSRRRRAPAPSGDE